MIKSERKGRKQKICGNEKQKAKQRDNNTEGKKAGRKYRK
jgi:hypothetical protein